MKKTHNVKQLNKLFHEVINKRNLTVADDIISSEFISCGIISSRVGVGGFKAMVQQCLSAFPGLKIVIEQFTAEEDLVAVMGYWEISCEEKQIDGDSTEHLFRIPYFDFWKFLNGKCIENSAPFDVMNLMQHIDKIGNESFLESLDVMQLPDTFQKTSIER